MSIIWGGDFLLSVSSNGSTWVKLVKAKRCASFALPFSILERIDVGETISRCRKSIISTTFSILERIDVGETAQCKAA